MMKRFKTGVNDLNSALVYYKHRAYQLLQGGWSWDGNFSSFYWGCVVVFVLNKEKYHSVFIYKDFRNKGYLSKWYKKNQDIIFFTLNECGIESHLVGLNATYKVAETNPNHDYIQLNNTHKNSIDYFANDFFMNLLDQLIFLFKCFNIREYEINNYLKRLNANNSVSVFCQNLISQNNIWSLEFKKCISILAKKYSIKLNIKVISENDLKYISVLDLKSGIKVDNLIQKQKIKKLRIDLTNVCNQECRFCPYHGIGSKLVEPSFADSKILRKVAETLANNNCKLNIRFSGSGEATIHPDFKNIISFYKSKGHSVRVITNGKSLFKNRYFFANQVDVIVVSLHGNKETHDALVKRKGAFNKTIKGIKAIKSINSKIRIIIDFVITPSNYLQIFSHAKFFINMGLEVKFQHLLMTPENQSMGIFNLIKLKEILKKTIDTFPEVRTIPPLELSQIDHYYNLKQRFIVDNSHCGNLEEDLFIDVNGDVVMCHNIVIGNIFNSNIMDIIESKTRGKYISDLKYRFLNLKYLPDNCVRCCYNK